MLKPKKEDRDHVEALFEAERALRAAAGDWSVDRTFVNGKRLREEAIAYAEAARAMNNACEASKIGPAC